MEVGSKVHTRSEDIQMMKRRPLRAFIKILLCFHPETRCNIKICCLKSRFNCLILQIIAFASHTREREQYAIILFSFVLFSFVLFSATKNVLMS